MDPQNNQPLVNNPVAAPVIPQVAPPQPVAPVAAPPVVAPTPVVAAPADPTISAQQELNAAVGGVAPAPAQFMPATETTQPMVAPIPVISPTQTVQPPAPVAAVPVENPDITA